MTRINGKAAAGGGGGELVNEDPPARERPIIERSIYEALHLMGVLAVMIFLLTAIPAGVFTACWLVISRFG